MPSVPALVAAPFAVQPAGCSMMQVFMPNGLMCSPNNFSLIMTLFYYSKRNAVLKALASTVTKVGICNKILQCVNSLNIVGSSLSHGSEFG